jgi:Response regulator containing CheY-like receiver, AAA-type ATPase, and DNA-binding domains
MNILVADDEDASRKLIIDMFVDQPSVQIAAACDGAEAWWKLTTPGDRYDLAICDLRMPIVDGLQFIERVRQTATLRHLPIILCTGINDRDTVARAARLAINHYVVKPYKPDALREKIRALAPRHAVFV